MKRTLTITCTLLAVVLMLATGPAVAAPLYDLKVNLSGIPYILHSTSGYGNVFGKGGFNGISAMTVDGNPYVAMGQLYSTNVLYAGEAYQSLNNSATPIEAVSSYVTHYGPSYPKTRVCNGWYDRDLSTETLTTHNDFCRFGMTRPFAEGRFFANSSSSATARVGDFQLEAEALLGDDPDATSNAAGLRSYTTITIDSNTNGLALYGQAGSADTWNLLVGSVYNSTSSSAPLDRLRKVEMGALTGLAKDAQGTRSYTTGGYLTNSAGNEADLFADLVPLVGDNVVDFAINPTDGNLYFLSIDETNNKAYLSAVSLTWGDLGDNVECSYVDLDTEATAQYLDITYNNGTDTTLASNARGLGFGEDGSVLYVAVNAYDDDPARVFILVPEPATMGLLGLGFAGMAALRRRRRKAS